MSATIAFEKTINIPNDKFEILKENIEKYDFFKYLSSFNSELINDYNKEEDGSIIITFKNIIDENDEELSLIKFKYTYENIDGRYIITILSDNDYENDDFFVVEFEDIVIVINKSEFKLSLKYNSKKYPKCVISMIQKYFEEMFLNFEKSYFSS